MQFGILGPLEVHDGERLLGLGGDKQRALLALLLIYANEAVSAERLIDELWDERPPQTAAKTLQVHVSRLRKALGPVPSEGDGALLTHHRGYELRVARERVDSFRFERLVGEARADLATSRFGSAAASFERALSLWRGPPLGEFVHLRAARAEIARLEELNLGASEDLVEAKLALGRHLEVVSDLESLISEHPYRERLRAQLMLALYRCERQAEALQAYQDARRRLVEDLGIEPGERLRELEREILNQSATLAFVEAGIVTPAEDLAGSGFVGRQRELQALVTGLEDARAGRGRLVLVSGEPGIGKSRLIEELTAVAETSQVRILLGRCWEAGGAPAYWPWVQALRMYLRDLDPDGLRTELGASAADLAQIVPEVQSGWPDLAEPPELDPELARFRLFDSVTEFLRGASKRQPLVVVLDDLHAADAPSLLLLRFLARELAAMSVLIIVAFRDVSPVPSVPLDDMIGEVARASSTLRLRLTGLSRQGVERYLELSKPSLASPQLGQRLYAQTDGNPLFVGELVRLLQPSDPGAGSGDKPELVIPQTIREVIERRLMLLSAHCRGALEHAAVIGREFSLRTLSAASDLPDEELLPLLAEAGSERVIAETPGEPGRFRFAHVLIRDAIYEGLGAAHRLRLHRTVLNALEVLHGDDPGPYTAELAHHAIAASESAKGLAYARCAAAHSLKQLAYEEAARLYQTALDVAEPTDEEDRCDLLLRLADAQARAGETSTAKAAFMEAAALARRLGLHGLLAQAAAGYGGRLAWARAGDDEQMVPLLEEGLEALGKGDIELRARLLARLAGALRDEPLRERRDALSEEAVELARRSRNPSTLAYTLDGRAAAIVAHDRAEELLAISGELRRAALRGADHERVVAGHIWHFHAQLFLGDIDGATTDLASAAHLATQLRQPVQLWLVAANRSMLFLAAGRLDEARELIEAGFELGMRAQPHGAVPIYWLQRLTLADFVGGLDELTSAFRDLVARYPARVMFRCAAAYLDLRLGHQAAAKRAIRTLAANNFSALPVDQEWLFGASLVAEVATAIGEEDLVAGLYTLLLPWADLNAVDVSEGIRGSVARYLGLLATALGRLDDAVEHFEQAIAANERMGALPWLAHTQRDYAQLLLVRNRKEDSERGLELIRDALITYQRLGMNAAAEQADGVRCGLQGIFRS